MLKFLFSFNISRTILVKCMNKIRILHGTVLEHQIKNSIGTTEGQFIIKNPVRIRVRIDPPHPLVCCKRRLNGAVLQMRPEKPRSRVTAGVAR
jgi:hypothetical protein